MNKALSDEIAKWEKAAEPFHNAIDSHPKTWLFAYLTGLKNAADLMGQVVDPRPTQRKTIRQAMLDRGPEPGPENDWAPKEPPPGFPKNESEAVQHADKNDVEPSFASNLWLVSQNRGWTNSTGKTIRDWTKYLLGCWRLEQQQRIQRLQG